MPVPTANRGAPEGVTRRRVLELTGGSAVAITTTQRTAATGDDPDTPLIDAHLHVTPIDSPTRNAFSAEQAIAWMDANDVDQAVLLPLESPTSWPYPVPTWWVLEEASRFPDRFIPFCVVAPQLVAQFGDETIQDQLEQYVEMGAQGLGELKAPMAFDDDRAQLVYDACADLDLPVLFHMDGVNMTDEVGLPNLEAMLQAYPEVDFLGHGAGWWASVSGNLEAVETVWPDDPVEPGGAVPRLLEEYDNIYGELSGGSGWNALVRDPDFGQAFLEEYHEQLLFGTDKLTPEQTVEQFELFERFELTTEQWEDIRYRNFSAVV
jgi:uncharacterized protein